jgi:glycosyltransferase involved in cell wall biosynthesis
MKINILFVIPQLDIGGAEIQLLNLVKGLDKSIFNIYVCNLSENQNKLEDEFKKNEVELVRIYKKSKFDLSIVKKLKLFIKNNNIHIVHSFLNNLWSRLACLGENRPIIIISERSLDDWWKKWYHFYFDNLLALITDKMVCNAYAIKSFYEVKVPKLKNKIEVIYNGIDDKRYKNSGEFSKDYRKLYNVDQKDICFGIVAGLRPIKDHMTLLKAANELKKDYDNFKVFIIGDGTTRKELERYVASHKLTNNVIFCGYITDIKNILDIIDVGILCSIQEGLSNAIIEYMLNKKPVIATNAGGNKELVLDNVNGFLINVGDYSKLKNKMEYFIKNRDKIKEFGFNSYKLAEEKFKYDLMIKKYSDLYIKLIKTKHI